MQYMIVETFTHGPKPVYARFRERGRLVPHPGVKGHNPLEFFGKALPGDGGMHEHGQ